MCVGNNQTKELALNFLEQKTGSRSFSSLGPTSPKGWGIFMVGAPDRGEDEFDDIIVANLTYPECVRRGQTATLFQWVPIGIEVLLDGKPVNVDSIKDLEFIRTSCHINDTCRGGCVIGCFCYGSDPLGQQCRKNKSRVA